MRDFTNNELMFDYRLSKLIRYNHRHRVKDESVAEHSYYVVLFCMKICKHYRFDAETTNNILTKAILHDLPEIAISDVPYDVKQNIPQLRYLLEDAEKEFYKKHYFEYYDKVYNGNTLEDLIVRYADTLSVLQYCLNELAISPMNTDFLEIRANTIMRLEAIKKEIRQELKNVRGEK